MVIVVQQVRTSDCGSEGRGFESHHSPKISSQRTRLRHMKQGGGMRVVDHNLLKWIMLV